MPINSKVALLKPSLCTLLRKRKVVVRQVSKYFETFFKVVVLLQEHGVVDDDLRCGNSEVDDAVVHGFCRLKTKERKDKIGSKPLQIKSGAQTDSPQT